MNEKSPLISVVIPCYNHGKYVEEAIDSCLQSTFPDFEIIVVNDGSTDPYTQEVLANLSKPKTLIIHQEHKGVSAARNTGIRHARGNYIFPLDADDMIDRSLLEREFHILETNPALGFVSCWVKSFGDSSIVWRTGPYQLDNLLVCNSVAVGSLFRKEAWEQVGGYNEQMRKGYEDWDFWISLGGKGWKGDIIPEALYYHRRHSPSMLTQAIKIHDELMEQIRQNHPELYPREKSGGVKRYRLSNMKPHIARQPIKKVTGMARPPVDKPAPSPAMSTKPVKKTAPPKRSRRKPVKNRKGRQERLVSVKTTSIQKALAKPVLFI